MVDPYYRISFRLKKEWQSDTCHSMDEPWRHDARWNKPNTKAQVLYDFTYRRDIYSSQIRRRKVEWQLPGAQRGGRDESLVFNGDTVSAADRWWWWLHSVGNALNVTELYKILKLSIVVKMIDSMLRIFYHHEKRWMLGSVSRCMHAYRI